MLLRGFISFASRRSGAFCLLGALTFVFFWPVFFLTDDYFWGSGSDMDQLQVPQRSFISYWLKRGVWPLWNPYIFNGNPVQTGSHSLFYPNTILQLFFSVIWEIKICLWLHVTLAAFCMWLFLRDAFAYRVSVS